jgi:hypothetical protein
MYGWGRRRSAEHNEIHWAYLGGTTGGIAPPAVPEPNLFDVDMRVRRAAQLQPRIAIGALFVRQASRGGGGARTFAYHIGNSQLTSWAILTKLCECLRIGGVAAHTQSVNFSATGISGSRLVQNYDGISADRHVATSLIASGI